MTTVAVRVSAEWVSPPVKVPVYTEVLFSQLTPQAINQKIADALTREKRDWFHMATVLNSDGNLFVDVDLIDNGIPYRIEPIIEAIREIGPTHVGPFLDEEPKKQVRLLYIPPFTFGNVEEIRKAVAELDLASVENVIPVSTRTLWSEAGAGNAVSDFIVGLSVSLTYDVVKHIFLLVRRRRRESRSDRAVLLPFDYGLLTREVSKMTRTPRPMVMVTSLHKPGFNKYAITLRAGTKVVSIVCNHWGRVRRYVVSD